MQNIADVYRVTPRQQDMLATLAAGRPGAHVGQIAWTVRHMADPEPLARAWRRAVASHPVLRTGLFTEGMTDPLQVVRGEAPLHWESRDGSGADEEEQAAALARLESDERARGFDPTAAPLMRVVQVRLGDDAYRFVWTWSALVLDDLSASRLMEEAAATYRALLRGEEPPAARPHPYRGYVAWLERQDAAASSSFWRESLRGAELPAGTEPAGRAYEARTRRAVLPVPETERLAAALRQHRLGWDAAVAGCWALALHARTGAAAPVVGLGVSGRPAGLAGSEGMPGSFRNTLPVVLPVDPGAAAAEWLRGAQKVRDALRPFEHVGLRQVREWAGLPADAALFESALHVASPEDGASMSLPAAAGFQDVSRESPVDGHPLEVRVVAGQEVMVTARFDGARVDAAGVDALLEGFLGILSAFGEAPGRRVAELREAAGAAAAPRVEVGDSHPGSAEVEAVLARHPSLASVEVRAEDGGLRARIVPRADAVARDEARKRLSFSLFYFADAGDEEGGDKYRIYLDGGVFADRHGFEAVWAPERHFHENGGLYPNPSVLSAALAPLTKRVALRAGSVALPLHHPLRVAEEWSVVDNLSRGRAGISVTSGWIPNDFALNPQNFPNKREVMFRMIEEVRELWRGGTLAAKDGAGKDVELRVFPRPIQPELPVWITCSGDPAVFAKAGELGHHCLTALLTQPLEEAAEKIGVFRGARERVGLDPAGARVTLMLHTFVADDLDEALARVKEPLTTYLRSHIGLMETMVKSLDLKLDINEPRWLDSLASFAFERYYRTGAFIGTPESCLAMVDRVVESDVDEVACLIDFGVDTESTLAALPRLNTLRAMCAEGAELGPIALRRHLARRIPDLRAPVTFEVAGAEPAPSPVGAGDATAWA